MPVRIAPAVTAVLVAALVVQTALWLLLGAPGPLAAGVALGLCVLCSTVGYLLLRRAFEPLVACATQLRDLASRQSLQLARTPSALARDPALQEIERLRQRLRDRVEESQRLREQAEEASAYKGGFLRSVRHELRTPLNSILGFAEVLLSDMEGPLSPGQRENVLVIRRMGRRLQDLFDEVIELATVSASQLELSRVAIDAGGLLEQVCEEIEEERGDRPVHVRVDVIDGVSQLAGDPYRLKQMLRGMASHALSVCVGQLLVLSASPGGGGVWLAVRDPARRLTSAELDVLLGGEPVASRRKGIDESTRLRIAIWQELARLYGGKLFVQSDERGTAYALELPSWGAA